DLTLISNYITQHDLYNSGYHLGRLQGDLVFLMEMIEVEEKKANQLKGDIAEEIQDEECDEEREEGSEEEDDSQESYYIQIIREKDLRIDAEKKVAQLFDKNKELEKANASIKATRSAIFDLQDLLLSLLRLKKISSDEIENVVR